MSGTFGRKMAARLGLGSLLRDFDTVSALMESESDAMALSSEGAIIYMNRAAKAFFGSKRRTKKATFWRWQSWKRRSRTAPTLPLNWRFGR